MLKMQNERKYSADVVEENLMCEGRCRYKSAILVLKVN